MRRVKDFAQKMIEFMQDKINRLRKMKRKNKWKLAGICLAVVVAAVAVGRLTLGRKRPGNAAEEMTVQSATAETGGISITVEGTGTLQQGTAENVAAPVGVEIDEILVEAGDTVTAGQQLATVDAASVAAQLLEVEEQLEDVKDEIDDLSDEADEEGTTEYLEAVVLKGERKDLRQAKKALNALLDSGAIEADSDGIIGEIYVSENAEVSSSSDSSGSSTSTGTSGTATATAATSEIAAATLLSTADETATAVRLLTASGTGTIKAVSLSQNEKDQSTSDTVINSCQLSVTAPAAGGVPQSSIAGTEAYTGEITWNCPDSTFQAGTVYTATIVLTANEGYCFSSDATVTVSGAASTAKEMSSDGKTLTVTASFAATAEVSTEETASTEGNSDTTESGNTDGTTATGSESGTGTAGGSGTGSSSSTSGTTEDGNGSSEDKAEKNSNGTTGNNNSNTAGEGGQSGGSYSGGSGNAAGGTAAGGSAAGTSSVSTGTSGSSTASSEEEYSLYEAAAFSIVNADEAVVSIQVDELDILSVEEGQSATITMDAAEGQEFEGTITEISTTSTGDSSSAKYPVEITLEKTDDMLYGMSASASIEVDEAENAVLIPVSALQEEGDSTFVYTESDEEGNLSGKVEVTIGLSDGSQVEITSGLEEGDTVYYLRTGSSDESSSDFSSMGGGMNGDMPSGGRGGSGGGNGMPGGNSGGPGGGSPGGSGE